MLFKTKKLEHYKLKLKSLDAEIGKITDFYFDDEHWTIRYLVADTGGWLTGRKVIISPYALGEVFKDDKFISVNLTKKQIEGSPSLASDEPVSRQYEETFLDYYGSPFYWGGEEVWAKSSAALSGSVLSDIEDQEDKETGDSHLRSINEVSSYHIHAIDGEIGHVEDFIIDDETWTIRYLVVSTRNWWPGKKVLISPTWIERVSWNDSEVYLNLTRVDIKAAPEYTDESLLERDYEFSLHEHYDRMGYWLGELLGQ
jgi:sporulation protein YlmC with PRC-barrel domain